MPSKTLTKNSSGDRRMELMAPTYKQFYEWWRQMRVSGTIPVQKDGEWVAGKQKFALAELHLGGYFNQEPNGTIIGTAVCSSRMLERLPLEEDATFITLPDERSDM